MSGQQNRSHNLIPYSKTVAATCPTLNQAQAILGALSCKQEPGQPDMEAVVLLLDACRRSSGIFIGFHHFPVPFRTSSLTALRVWFSSHDFYHSGHEPASAALHTGVTLRLSLARTLLRPDKSQVTKPQNTKSTYRIWGTGKEATKSIWKPEYQRI